MKRNCFLAKSEQIFLRTTPFIVLTLFLGNQVMASKITLVNKNNSAQSLKFYSVPIYLDTSVNPVPNAQV